jgi:MFS family permease
MTTRSTLPWRAQWPALLVGLGHGGTHWVAAFFYLLLPYVTRELDLSYAQAGLMVSVFHAASATANLGSGLIVDLTGRKVVFQVVSLLMGAAALLAFGLTSEFVLLCALALVIGVSNNLWHPPAIAFLSERFPANRGYALSLHALGANLGDTVAPLACGALLASLSWHATAVTGALPVFAVAVVVGLALWRGERQPATAHAGAGLGGYLRAVGTIVRDRHVLGLCVMAGFRSMTQNGLYVFLPLYLVNVVGAGPVVMGAAMMALQAGGVVAAPLAGAWSDRVGRRQVVLAGLSVTTLVLVLLTVTRDELAFVAGVSVMGFALFAVRPVVHSWMMDITPPGLAGSATSLMFGTQALLSAAVPVVGGLVADVYGLPVVFYLLAATMLVANGLVALLPPKDPQADRTRAPQ